MRGGEVDVIPLFEEVDDEKNAISLVFKTILPKLFKMEKIYRFYFNEDLVRFFPPEEVESLSNAIMSLVMRPEMQKRLMKNAAEFVKKYDMGCKKNKNILNY